MTYENEYWEYIVEPLMELFRIEFGSIKILSDEHKGNESWLFKDLPFTLDDIRNRGESYQYEIELIYDHIGRAKLDRVEKKHLYNIMERAKKLVHNYRDFEVEKDWVDESGTWGSTSNTWGTSHNTYCWHGGVISEVDFDQEDVLDGHYQFKMIFSCYRESSYAQD